MQKLWLTRWVTCEAASSTHFCVTTAVQLRVMWLSAERLASFVTGTAWITAGHAVSGCNWLDRMVLKSEYFHCVYSFCLIAWTAVSSLISRGIPRILNCLDIWYIDKNEPKVVFSHNSMISESTFSPQSWQTEDKIMQVRLKVSTYSSWT